MSFSIFADHLEVAKDKPCMQSVGKHLCALVNGYIAVYLCRKLMKEKFASHSERVFFKTSKDVRVGAGGILSKL